ncbi:MAG: BrnA antitoxin family protein [Gammaproteobacteria bacterium]|nr:BrnA antitoxin family protein [Gammaproteobacteria bacterium]
MKQPKMTNLRIDAAGTKKMRSAMQRARSVKITINIDADSLSALRETAERTGVPYQRLLNNILREGLSNQALTEDRLARIEKELARIKKKLAA